MPYNTYVPRRAIRRHIASTHRQHLSPPYMYVCYVHAVAGHDARLTPRGVALDAEVPWRTSWDREWSGPFGVLLLLHRRQAGSIVRCPRLRVRVRVWVRSRSRFEVEVTKAVQGCSARRDGYSIMN